jgi:serine/threonine protein kinase
MKLGMADANNNYRGDRSRAAKSDLVRPSLTYYGDYRKGEMLGEGSFGSVYKVTKNFAMETYALKVVNWIHKDARNEVEILRKVEHIGIVSYIEHFIHGGRLCIVMEFSDVGTVDNVVQKFKYTSRRWNELLGAEWSVWRFLSHVSNALAYLHGFKHDPILHRDLHPGNILGFTVDCELEKKEVTNWKLADFGIAKLVDSRHLNSFNTSAVPGMFIYMAPEVLDGEKYTFDADMWSLGAVMSFWCNIGTHLFPNPAAVLQWPGVRSSLPKHYSVALRGIIFGLLQPIPSRRPAAKKVLEETWKHNRQEIRM